MNLTTLRYEEHGDVATCGLLQPRMNMKMVRELTAVCDHLEDESACTAVVFRGDGPGFWLGQKDDGVFCVTARPEEVREILDGVKTVGPLRRLDLVLVPKEADDAHQVLEDLLSKAPPSTAPNIPVP